MHEFMPIRYQNEYGQVFWQPTLPDGTRFYYDYEAVAPETDPKMVTVTEYEAKQGKYTPAVVNSYRNAVKVASNEWNRRIKDFNA